MRSRSIGSGFSLMLLVAAMLWLGSTPFTVAHATTWSQICQIGSSGCGGGTSGRYPQGGLVADSSGNLYGTTSSGGAHGFGTIFMLSPSGTYTVLHDFCPGATCCPSSDDSCQDGNDPVGSLILDVNGNLYGTTAQGGPNTGPDNATAGIAFKLRPPNLSGGSWTIHRLWSFCSSKSGVLCSDGEAPMSNLSYKPTSSSPYYNGTDPLYGTTKFGGAYGGQQSYALGTVFELTRSGGSWTETVIHSFGDPAVGNGTTIGDGFYPTAGVTLDSSGNIFGTASSGGVLVSYAGVIFKIDTSNSYSLLYEFCTTYYGSLCTDGRGPNANLLLDSSGNIFGTTPAGSTDHNQAPIGVGVVFELPSGSSSVTVLHSFCAGQTTSCTDGLEPAPGSGLVLTSTGDLYGATEAGGLGNPTNQGGLVYKLHPSGGTYALTAIHTFCHLAACNMSPADGNEPVTDLYQDSSGNMYGTTLYGGTGDGGTIYKVVP